MKRSSYLILFVFLFSIVFISNLHQVSALSCYITTNCNPPNVTIFKMSGLTNAHAEIPTQNNYDYKVCCMGVNNTCTDVFDVVLKLSSGTNAHVEKKTYTNYNNNVCLSILTGRVKCDYASNCASLGPDYSCLASISSDSNAHVGDCNAYSEKVCCEVEPGVILDPICDPEDFTGECQNLALYGDLSYLNIKWSAYYIDRVERRIAVDCYLNCPNPGDNIKENCRGYETPRNYCNHISLTGRGFCTIVNPEYVFQGQTNNITCSFYNPDKSIRFLPYPNRTFKPVDFELSSTLGFSATIGKPFVLPVKVINKGLFLGNFTSYTSATNPNLVYIENPTVMIENLKYNKIGEIYSRVTLLSAEANNLKVVVKSDLDQTTCSDHDCPDFYGSNAECRGGRCWKGIILTFNPGMLSLPEFDWTGLLQIIILSTVAVFFLKTKHK